MLYLSGARGRVETLGRGARGLGEGLYVRAKPMNMFRVVFKRCDLVTETV